MNTRIITSWELSHCGHRVTVWWLEPGPTGAERQSATWDSFAPIQPWQITGLVTALRKGVPFLQLDLPETSPAVSLIDRGLGLIASVIGRLTEGRPMAGGRL